MPSTERISNEMAGKLLLSTVARAPLLLLSSVLMP